MILQNIRANFNAAINKAEKLNHQNPQLNLRQLSRHAQRITTEATQAFGYYSPLVSTRIENNKQQNTSTIHLKVHLGNPTIVTKSAIIIKGAGANDPTLKKIQQQLPLQVGDVFTLKKYQQTKKLLFTAAEQSGYITAKFTQHHISINVANNTAQIRLTFRSGRQFLFGKVNFSKSSISNTLLQRFVPFKTGDVFTTQQMLLLQQSLANASYFSNVQVTPKKQPKSKLVPVDVNLTEARHMQYVANTGYGTDTGFRAGFGWQWRRINRYGHHSNVQIDVSQIGGNVVANYFIPGRDPAHEQYNLVGNVAYFNTDAGSSHLTSFGWLYNKNIASTTLTTGMVFQNETYRLHNETTNNQASLLMPTLTWMKLLANHLTNPTQGLRITANLRGASKQLASSSNFAQANLRINWLQPLTSKLRWLSRVNVGATAINHLNDLPLSLQFTAGGALSVRGYGFQSLGPGKYLLTGTAELQYQFVPHWYAGVFCDAGNAFNNIDTPNLKTGAGISAIWQSPIGTMELSLTQPSTNPSDVVVQFSLGAML